MAKVLVIGSGGREHAIVRALVDDADVEEILCAPGNGGTAAMPRVRNIAFKDYEALIKLAKEEHVDLTVVGPENPLAEGIVDLFHAHGLKIFGFKKAAAKLEWSKVYAKYFMRLHKIPTAPFRVFESYDAAFEHLKECFVKGPKAEFFIKADELCAGKGAIHAKNLKEGEKALRDLLIEKRCGKGERVVIEDALKGTEASILAFVDTKGAFKLMPPAQDYKRRDDGDRGPNTGGMGAYAPAPLITQAVMQRVEEQVIHPTLNGMKAEGVIGCGILYFGLMIDSWGQPYVLEYNTRFGDPEAQAILPLLRSDLYPILLACTEGRLDQTKLQWRQGAAVCVVLAVSGYPTHYGREREVIEGLEETAKMRDVMVYHAGTMLQNGKFITQGGRVLNVVGLGKDVAEARKRAYAAVNKIRFNGMSYRKDIAARAVSKFAS